MLSSLKIENFRAFSSFELRQLGQINLLVGANNSGKTSILEALYLLYGPDNALTRLMTHRQEFFLGDNTANQELDIRYLFHGRKIDLGSEFSISSNNEITTKLSVVVNRTTSQEAESENRQEIKSVLSVDAHQIYANLNWYNNEQHNQSKMLKFALSDQGCLGVDAIALKERKVDQIFSEKPKEKIQFLTHLGVTRKELIKWFDRLVLTSSSLLVVSTTLNDLSHSPLGTLILCLNRSGDCYNRIRNQVFSKKPGFWTPYNHCFVLNDLAIAIIEIL